MTPGVRDEGDRGSGREELGGKREMVKRPEERTSERGRELVRAGAFPLANSRARDGRGERGKDIEIGTRKRGRKKNRGGRE